MITAADVKRACNDKVKEAFPGIRVYGNDTTDGYACPAFFSEILHHGYMHESLDYAKNGATYKLTLFEESHDEAYCLEVFERLKEAFGMVLKVKGRHLLVGDMSYEFIGENANMLQVSAEFDWMEQKARTETYEMMETIKVKMVCERGR